SGLGSALAFPGPLENGVGGVLVFGCRSLVEVGEPLFSMMQAMGSQIGQFLRRQRVEGALRDSEVLYHSLVENLPQNVFRKDWAGRLTFANRRYCETLQRPLAELLGMTDFDLFPHDLATKYVRDDHTVMETGA